MTLTRSLARENIFIEDIVRNVDVFRILRVGVLLVISMTFLFAWELMNLIQTYVKIRKKQS